MLRSFPILLGPDPDPAVAAAPATGGALNLPAGEKADPAEGWKALLAKHQGDASRVSELLYNETHDLRSKLREARKQVPAEGALVLTVEQAKSWSTYQTLGTAEHLQTALAERDTFKSEAEGFRKAKLIGEVSQATGYVKDVLGPLVEKDRLALEVREVIEPASGKKLQVAFVKGEGGTETKLTDYARDQWSAFLPALQPAAPPPKLGTPLSNGAAGNRLGPVPPQVDVLPRPLRRKVFGL